MAKQNKKRLKIVGAVLAAVAVVVVTAVMVLSPAQNLRYASTSVLSIDGTNCPGTWDSLNLTCNLNAEVVYTDQFELTLDGSTLDCNGATIQASGTPATIFAFNKTNVSVKNCTIYNDSGWGIYYSGVVPTDLIAGGKSVINNNTFVDVDGAVNLIGGTAYVEVSNNTVLDDPTAGNTAFSMWNSSDNYLHNNTVGDVNQLDGLQKYEFWGFSVDGGSNNNLIENNVASTDKAGAYVGSNSTNTGNRFVSNIFENNTYWGMYIVDGVSTEVTNNIMCGNGTDMYIDVLDARVAVLSSYVGNTGDTVFDNASGFTFDYACALNTCDDTVAYLQGLGYTAYNVNGDIVVVYNEGTANEVSVTYEACDVPLSFIADIVDMANANSTSIIVDGGVIVEENNSEAVTTLIEAISDSESDTGAISTDGNGGLIGDASDSESNETNRVNLEPIDEEDGEVAEGAIIGAIDAEGNQDATITKDDIDNDFDVIAKTIDPDSARTADPLTGNVIKTASFELDLDTLVLPAYQDLVASVFMGVINSDLDSDTVVNYDSLAQSTDVTSWTTDGAGLVINTNIVSLGDDVLPAYQSLPAYQDLVASTVTGLIDAEVNSITTLTFIVDDVGIEIFNAAIVTKDPYGIDLGSTNISIEDIEIKNELLSTIIEVSVEQAEITSSVVLAPVIALDGNPLPITRVLLDSVATIDFEKTLLANSVEEDYLYAILTSLYETYESYDSVFAEATVDTNYINQLVFIAGAETYNVAGGTYVTVEELAQSIYDLFDYGTLDVRCGVRGQENRACGENVEVSLHLKSCADTWNNYPEDVAANCASFGVFAEDSNNPADDKFRYYTGSAPYGEYFLSIMDPDLLDPMGLPTYSSHPTILIPEDTSANVIMHIKPDGKNQGMKSNKKTGSELWIYEPIDVVWVGDIEYYPFYFESDSDWSVNICMEVPEGYDIIEGQDCLQTFVANEEREILFKVKEVGSIPYDSLLNWEFTDPHGKKIKEKSKIGVRLHPSLAKEKRVELLEKGFEIDEKGRIKKVKKD